MVKKLVLAQLIMNLSTLNNPVKIFIFVFLFLIFTGSIFPFEVKAGLNKSECRIGDIVELKLSVICEPHESIDILKKKGDYFDIYLRDVSVKKSKDGCFVLYHIQPFFLGKKKLPLIPLKINGKSVTYTPPELFVKSITDDKSEPKPLKPPYDVVVKRSYGIQVIFGVVFLFLLILFLYFLKVRRKRELFVEEDINQQEIPEVKSFSNFLSKIEGLKKSKLYEKDGRYFAFLLNKFIRDILGLYFSKNFLILTNSEVIEFLESQNIGVKEDLKWLLGSCELVEFSPESFKGDFYERMVNIALKVGGYFNRNE